MTAVYIGYDNPLSLGGGATGGGLAAPVWGRYMREAHRGEERAKYEFTDVRITRREICENTGMLPDENCSARIVEMFLPGTEPTTVATDVFGPAPGRQADG